MNARGKANVEQIADWLRKRYPEAYLEHQLVEKDGPSRLPATGIAQWTVTETSRFELFRVQPPGGGSIELAVTVDALEDSSAEAVESVLASAKFRQAVDGATKQRLLWGSTGYALIDRP